MKYDNEIGTEYFDDMESNGALLVKAFNILTLCSLRI